MLNKIFLFLIFLLFINVAYGAPNLEGAPIVMEVSAGNPPVQTVVETRSSSSHRPYHLELCRDGIDNDGDNLTDYPDDLGCENAFDENETDVVVEEEVIEIPIQEEKVIEESNEYVTDNVVENVDLTASFKKQESEPLVVEQEEYETSNIGLYLAMICLLGIVVFLVWLIKNKHSKFKVKTPEEKVKELLNEGYDEQYVTNVYMKMKKDQKYGKV